jgi:hypothetical protein
VVPAAAEIFNRTVNGYSEAGDGLGGGGLSGMTQCLSWQQKTQILTTDR